MKFPSVVFAVLLSALTVRAFGFPSFMSSSSTLTTDAKSDDPKPSEDASKTTKHTDTEPECDSDSGNKSEFLGFGDSNPSPAPPGKTGKAPAATKSQLVDESEDYDEKASMFGREDSKFFGKDKQNASMFGSDEDSNKSELFGGSDDQKCKFFGKDKDAKMFGREDSKFFGKDEKTSMFGSDEDGSKSELFGGSSDKSNKPTFSEDSTSGDDETLTKE